MTSKKEVPGNIVVLCQHIFTLLPCWEICPCDFSELLISSGFSSEASLLVTSKGESIIRSQHSHHVREVSEGYKLVVKK